MTEKIRILIFSCVCVMAFGMLADWRRLHPGASNWIQHDNSEQLGAEYDSIARAIRSGRGFSDPFHVESGPTAWMPPVLPYSLAALYWISGDSRAMVVEVFVCVQAVFVMLACFFVLSEAQKYGQERVCYVVLLVALALNFFELFQKTHDSVLLLAVVSFVCYGSTYYLPRINSAIGFALWGISGGLTALCSPAVGLAWAVVTMMAVLRCHPNRPLSLRLGNLVIVATVAILLVMPWTIRNYVVLGKFIPIKSNAGFELWQSQCLDDDGVSDLATVMQHPWASDGIARKEYLELGEIAFIRAKKDVAMRAIWKDPLDFVERILNRFMTICLYYEPRHPEELAQIERLMIKRLIFPLPFMALCILVFNYRKLNWVEVVPVAIYISYLLPYLLLGYNPRYGTPIIVVKILLLLHVLSKFSLSYSKTRSCPKTVY